MWIELASRMRQWITFPGIEVRLIVQLFSSFLVACFEDWNAVWFFQSSGTNPDCHNLQKLIVSVLTMVSANFLSIGGWIPPGPMDLGISSWPRCCLIQFSLTKGNSFKQSFSLVFSIRDSRCLVLSVKTGAKKVFSDPAFSVSPVARIPPPLSNEPTTFFVFHLLLMCLKLLLLLLTSLGRFNSVWALVFLVSFLLWKHVYN